MTQAALRLSALAEKKEKGSQTYGSWQDIYREKWTWDRVVKGTCNRADCIAACSLDLFVKDGIVWREEQNAIFEQTNETVPDFNPRGCQKGIIYSDLMYDASRIKYPLRRVGERGSGKWERISWDDALTEIADKVLDVCKEDGPESVIYDFGTTNIDFGPGTPAEQHLIRLIGTTSLDEWAGVGDLPMGAIQTWGLFTADGTSDDWFNAETIIVWLGNPVYTRVPDVHFMFEARYNGARVVTIAPDYNATVVHSDLWLNPRVGTDAALALAMCNVIVEEGLQKKRYVQEQTDLPFLLREDTGRFLRQSDLAKDGKDDIFYIWDLATKTLQEAPGTNGQPEASIDLGDLDPAMEGEYEIELLDGRNVTVRPAFMALKKRLDEYTPERAAEITGVGAGMIRRLARQVAESPATMIFCSWGSCKHYHMDLVQRSIILLLALTGNTGKRGAGMRIGAWWNMSLSYDKAGVGALAAAGGDAERPKVRDVENIMKTLMKANSTISPTMPFLYKHDKGYAKLVNTPGYHDPDLKRPISEYMQEAFDKDWMPVYPRDGKTPRVFLYTGMNPLRRWPAPDVIRENLWANFELIVTWEFRMSSSAMYSDIILPAAGWHEKSGIKFCQSYVPYICVGEQAVEPLYESKNEFDIMANLAETLERRAKEREEAPYKDAFGNEHDPREIFRLWSFDGEFGEGDAEKALSVQFELSDPVGDATWEEAAQKGAVPVKSTGGYGPITAITNDFKEGETLYPFAWFVEGKESWPTLTGRQQFYIDHPWFLEAGEELPTHKEPPPAGGDYPLRMTGGHTRWSIHSIWRSNRTLLRLQRGGPVMYISTQDAKERGLKDHDEARVRNDVGEFKVRVKLAPSVQPGQVVMYHAWEPYQFEQWSSQQAVNPSPLNPLHLVGDYVQLQYRFALAQPSNISRAMTVELTKVT
ncbi:MAG: molybdopterin-dependent oxidoreductase [Chloroflexi bacterium]|nr:molybdopterin-dependent oxidoreductase [Chloroflexota bacterium]